MKNSKLIFFNSKKVFNKKALISLEFLVGTLLSSIVLLFLFLYLANTFLITPKNTQIAEDNMFSIIDFLGSSSEKYYGTYKNCYTELKISNLENFQFSEENEKGNFFYLLRTEKNQGYISVYSLDKYEELINNFEDQKFDLPKAKFEEKINVNKFLLDVTDSGSWFGTIIDNANPLGILGLISNDLVYSFGAADSRLIFEENKIKYIILVPQLKDSNKVISFAQQVLDDTYSINLLKPYIILNDGGIEEYSNVNKLVFRPRDGSIFIPKNNITNVMVDMELCSTHELLIPNIYSEYNKMENGKFVNIDDFDFMNYEIKIDGNIANNACSERFSWIRGPICSKNNQRIDCNNFFPTINSNIDFQSFYNLVVNYYNNNNQCYGTDNILKYTLIPDALSLDYMKKNPYDIKFDQLFEVYKDENGNEVNIYDLNDNARRTYVYDIATKLGVDNREFNNGNEEEFSNLVAYVDGKSYFYVDGNENNAKYYFFNSQFFRKVFENNQEKIYFNGQEVESYKENPISGYLGKMSWTGREEKKFYWEKINVEGNLYDVLLTPNQYNTIPWYEGDN